ncbi:MAG TPA: hypothetical protein VIM14_00275 [Polyangia bacterium]
MSPNLLEPRRLRESAERPSSIEGRLARQLRVLSVYAPTAQLRRYSTLPRRRRYVLTTVRIVAVATIVLAVSGVATATAAYLVRQVWPRPAAVDRVQSLPASATAKHRARPSEASGVVGGGQGPRVGEPSPASPAVALLREPEGDGSAVSASAAPPSSGRPALPLPPKSRAIDAKRSGSVATQPHGPPAEAPPTPAQTVEPPALPALPLPTGTGTTSPAPSGHATSPVRSDGVTQEAGLLRQVLSALRHDHDAKRALSLLDDYDRRFGQGALAVEATSARAQALLQLGDNAHALELLDRLPLSQDRHTGELRVIRGELRSLSGRCRDALLDFDAVLHPTAGNAPDEVARALFGRASCRARTGNSVGAEEDRQRYLKEFPKGPAARQLSSPP